MANISALNDSGKEVVSLNGGPLSRDLSAKEAYFSYMQEKQICIPNGPQLLADENKYPIPLQTHSCPEVISKNSRIQKSRRVILILVSVFTIFVIVLAATLGGILGSRNDPGTRSDDGESSPEESRPSLQFTQYGLAAIGFRDGGIPQTRVYYQNSSGYLWESRKDENHADWVRTSLDVKAQSGSALAAAVSRPGYELQISVFSLDESANIQSHNWNPTTQDWTSGRLSSDNWQPSQTTSLTAMFDQCALCYNESLLVFQDENQIIQMANLTSTGWIVTPLPSSAVAGSGLAIVQYLRNNNPDQLNLYYQRETDDFLSLATRNPGRGWSAETSEYRSISQGTVLAVASSNNNVSSGRQEWIQLLSTNRLGLSVDTWSGQENGWLVHGSRPLPMSNSTSSRRFDSVAITALGTAFAVTRNADNRTVIESWQVGDDMITWTSTGTVDVGGSWG